MREKKDSDVMCCVSAKALKAALTGVLIFILLFFIGKAFRFGINGNDPQAIASGALMQTLGTIVGAAFVVLAAQIQASAIREQAQSDKEIAQLNISHQKDVERQIKLRRYIGWFMAMINTYAANGEQNRARAFALTNWRDRNPLLNGVADIDQWINGFMPISNIVDPAYIDLMPLAPPELLKFINTGSTVQAKINYILVNIRNRYIARANVDEEQKQAWSAEIQTQIVKLCAEYEKLWNVYEQGLPLARSHLDNLLNVIEGDSFPL